MPLPVESRLRAPVAPDTVIPVCGLLLVIW